MFPPDGVYTIGRLRRRRSFFTRVDGYNPSICDPKGPECACVTAQISGLRVEPWWMPLQKRAAEPGQPGIPKGSGLSVKASCGA